MATIAIFDSGVGGLSIYQEIASESPEHNYVFVSDNRAFPYGTKPEAELCERVIKVVSALVKQYAPDLLVIACNTASTVALPALRARYQIPVVGVVPAIKPAAKLSANKVIGVLATPATVNRQYTSELINDFANGCEVIRLGSGELVSIAEDKLRGHTVDMPNLRQILKPLLEIKELDVLVLACTHFPLLTTEIATIFKSDNHPIRLIESSSAIAKRVAVLLASQIKPETHVHKITSPEARAQGTDSKEAIAVFTQTMTDTKLLNNLSYLGFNRIETLQLI